MEARTPVVRRHTLDGGLRLMVAEVPYAPTFAAILSFEAGSRYDAAEKAGAAALTSALLVERPGEQGDALDLRVDRLGLSLDAFAGYETAALLLTGVASSCSDGLALLRELADGPSFSDSTLEDAIARQLTEIAEEEDDPYCVCRRALFEEVFGRHPRGRPVIGYERTVGALRLGDVKSFRDARYVPRGAILALAGGVDGDRVLDQASRAFEGWTGPPPPREEPRPPVPPAIPRSRFVAMDRSQVHLALGSVAIARSDPSYYALLVADAILGDGAGFGSRLASRLREDEGLAYVVESDAATTAGLDPGLFWVYTATSPSLVDGALRAVREELARIRSEPPSADELESAKAYVRGRDVLALETNEARAARLVGIERYGLGDDYGERFAGLIDAVSAEDVLAAARLVIDLDRSALVLVGPRGSGVLP